MHARKARVALHVLIFLEPERFRISFLTKTALSVGVLGSFECSVRSLWVYDYSRYRSAATAAPQHTVAGDDSETGHGISERCRKCCSNWAKRQYSTLILIMRIKFKTHKASMGRETKTEVCKDRKISNIPAPTWSYGSKSSLPPSLHRPTSYIHSTPNSPLSLSKTITNS